MINISLKICTVNYNALKQIINKIAGFISGHESENSGYLASNSMRLFILQCISIGISFLVNYVLIKTAGVANYGSFVYVFNSISLLGNFCLLGMDILLVKNVSVYDAYSDYGKLKGILFFSLVVVFFSSIIVAVISLNSNFLFKAVLDSVKINWFALILSSLLLLSLSSLNQATLQALKKMSLSQLTEKIIRPVLLLIMITVLFFFRKIRLIDLIWSNVLAIGVTCIVSFVLIFKKISPIIMLAKREYDIKTWSKSTIAFFMIGLLNILNSRVDIFFLGFLKENREVGIFNILVRISDLTSFALVIVNFVLAPLVVRLFANGDLALLQKLITRSAQASFLIGFPLMVLTVIFRNYILLLFGVNSINASKALLVLCSGQLVNLFFGSVGLLLILSGNEKFSIISLAIAIVFNIVLDIVLIPAYGIIGAAIAASGGLVIWNFLMYFFVRRRLNILTTAIKIV